jgi:hypothetical protein
MRISSLFKRLRRWSSQAFRKRYSPAAFRTCTNAGNSVLTAEVTTSKGTGSISCEGEFCIFYRLTLRTLRTKDVKSLFSNFANASKTSCKVLTSYFESGLLSSESIYQHTCEVQCSFKSRDNFHYLRAG